MTSLADLDQIEVRRSDGSVAARGGFSVVLLFEGGTDTDRRLASLAPLKDYGVRIPGVLDHWMPDGARGLRRVSGSDWVAHYRERALGEGPGRSSGASLTHCPTAADSYSAPKCKISVLWSHAHRRWSCLVAYLTAEQVLSMGAGPFRALVSDWARMLNAASGVAGPSLNYDIGSQVKQTSRLCWPLLARHPGLDWPDAGVWAIEAMADPARSIRTINWLTLLDDDVVARL